MPGSSDSIFNDRWGINWRIKNQIKRFDLRRSLRLCAGLIKNPGHERPVFILGAPRSGTTLLFRILGLCPELGHLPREGHIMWRMFHHPRYGGWVSDAIGAGELRLGERRFINAYLKSFFSQKRFVEKTPENTLRIPYLLDLFPDAHFVVIKRNPCDVVNSLIKGWHELSGRYRSYYVPQELHIPGYPHRRQWRFALVKGWQDMRTCAVKEIALEQWRQCVAGIQDGRELVPESRWTEISLEGLLAQPQETMERVLARIEVRTEADFNARLTELVAKPVNALTAHQPDKWRQENPKLIMPLLASMQDLARKSGYEIDAASGDCSEAL